MTFHPLEERLSYRCSLISTRIARFITPMLEMQYELTLTNWRVLAVIGRYAPLSGKEVAVHTSTDAFFVSRAVDQLVSKGLVNRGVDGRDRRRTCLTLTARGKTVHHEIEEAINRIEEAIVRSMSEQEEMQLRRALEALDRRTMDFVQGDRVWSDFWQAQEPQPSRTS